MMQLLKDLEFAKKAVESCLKNESVLVNFHGLRYWAGRVEDLRNEIKNAL